MRDGMEDVNRLLESSSLPEAARAPIAGAVSLPGLRPVERVDVARELIAHFEDGLASGREVDDLLADFGNNRIAADLIRRSKRAGRRARAVDERTGRSGDAIVYVLARDLRYAFRRLRQSPGFTLAAILSLALGIGANTAIFSVVNLLLLKQLPVNRPDELVEIYESSTDTPHGVFSIPDYFDFRDRTTDAFKIIAGTRVTLGAMDVDGAAENLMIEAVTGTYFPLLELPPTAGRLLGPEDDVSRGSHPVVVLDHGFWQRRHGGDPGIVGNDVVVSGIPLTVIGIAPEAHLGMIRGLRPDLYVSVQMIGAIQGSDFNELEARGNHSFFVRARLADGVSLEQATQAARAVEVDLRQLYPDYWRADNEFMLVPTADVVLFPAFDGALSAGAWLLLAVVGMVLLMACANLAGFLLARAVDRRKEISVRLALGATRGKLIGQLLSETVLLSSVGGAAGLALAWWMLRALAAADIPFPIPLTFDFAIDTRVMLFAGLTSVLTGVLFGLAPALRATGYGIAATLRDESAGAGHGGRLRLRNVLVIGQVAVSAVLLVAAGLLMRSVSAMYTIDPGFGSEPTAIVSVSVPANRYDAAERAVLIDELMDRFAAMPSVDAVGLTTNLYLNLTNTSTNGVAVDGVAPPPGRDFLAVDWAVVDSGFFNTVGIPIVAGRNFDDTDTADARPVAIVSREFVARFYPDGQPLGRTFTDDNGVVYEIVGVTADTKVRTISEPTRPYWYVPHSQVNRQFVTFVARTSQDAEATAAAMLRSLREHAPDLMVSETKTMAEHLDVVRFPARVAALTVGAFAVLALALAAVGLFGLVSYAQAQRSREVRHPHGTGRRGRLRSRAPVARRSQAGGHRRRDRAPRRGRYLEVAR